jgi:hypothetical protein
VCGKPVIDIEFLKRNTQYSIGVTATSPHIIYFWEVLTSLTQEERKKFIRFAWAQERIPADDQEFARTNTRMLIKPYSGTANPDKAFIKADTCFFNLTVPEYSSPEILKERLLMAIHTDSDSMNADAATNSTMRVGGTRAEGRAVHATLINPPTIFSFDQFERHLSRSRSAGRDMLTF